MVQFSLWKQEINLGFANIYLNDAQIAKIKKKYGNQLNKTIETTRRKYY